MIIRIEGSSIPFERKIQGLCKMPFYGHPNGCPNWGKKKGCPPQPLIDGYFDLEKEVYLIYTSFPVGEFAERMKRTHPQWKDQPRQWYNPRRWQGRARKLHYKEIEKLLKERPYLAVNRSPEANGVNVTELMKKIGIELKWQWPPKHSLENTVYQVSLAGILKKPDSR